MTCPVRAGRGCLTGEKQGYRDKLRRRRARAFADDQGHGSVAGEQIVKMAAALFEPPLPQVVAGYMPISNELDPRPLMAAFAQAGARLCLPEVVEKASPLRFRAWAPGDLLSSGILGTVHPVMEAEELVPDFLIVPVLGVDARGVRLGQGGGFYDRTLAALRAEGDVRVFGAAFDEQLVDELPQASHDQLLDGLVSPGALIMWDEQRQRKFLAQQ